MQIPIFQPNNHSVWQITYRSVDPETKQLITDIVVSAYANPGESVFTVEQVAEVEINSNNFKVDLRNDSGEGRIVLLRRIKNERDRNKLATFYRIAEYLRERVVPVSNIIYANKNELFYISADYFYVAFEFISANHYRGTLSELEDSGIQFGKMDKALLEYPEAQTLQNILGFPEPVLALRSFSREVWEDLFFRAEKHSKNNDAFDSKLLEHKEFIFEAVGQTVGQTPSFVPKQIIHFDLHPHNLLCDGAKITAIIDFDSLRYLERARGLAFGLHRMVRQYIIHNTLTDFGREVRKAKDLFLTGYLKNNSLTETELGALGYYIRHEALSRLSYAMKDYYYNGKSDWLADLDKQTANIAESYFFS